MQEFIQSTIFTQEIDHSIILVKEGPLNTLGNLIYVNMLLFTKRLDDLVSQHFQQVRMTTTIKIYPFSDMSVH